MAALAAGSSRAFNYQDESKLAAPVPSGGMAQPAPPQAGPRQLNSTESWDTKGIAGAALGRVAHFVGGVVSGGGLPGGSMMKTVLGGGAAEGGAAEGAEGAGAAEGIGAVAEEAAPLVAAAF